jgi:hypothetical protein
MSLLWALESQSYSNGIYVLVLPTEKKSSEKLRNNINNMWHMHSKIVVNTELLQLPDTEYDKYCCMLESICTNDWRKKLIQGGWSEETTKRYCAVNTPLHYHLTDIAISHVILNCPSCKYITITNADNYYSPDFLENALETMESDPYHDVTLTNMIHRGQPMAVKPENGHMDLGCAVVNINFLKSKNISFVSSLPIPTEPQHWHDADFWFVDTIRREGGSYGIIDKYLFVHN